MPPQHSSKVADVPESSSLRKAAALLLEASPDSSKGLLDDLLEAAIASAAGDERSIESEADSIERWLINSSRPSKSAGLPQVSFSESLMGLAAVGSTSVSPATGQIRQPLPTKIPRRPRTSRAPASDPGDVTKFQVGYLLFRFLRTRPYDEEGVGITFLHVAGG